MNWMNEEVPESAAKTISVFRDWRVPSHLIQRVPHIELIVMSFVDEEELF